MTFDPGLQPERTALSLTRTCTSLVAGTVIGLKLLPAQLGGWVTVPCLVAIAAAVAISVLARRRAERTLRALLAGRALVADGGLLLLLVAASVAAAAVFAGLVVAGLAVRG